MDEGMLTAEEVAEKFRVSTRTVLRLIDAGQIRAIRVGRQWRFKKEWVDEWVERNTTDIGEKDVG